MLQSFYAILAIYIAISIPIFIQVYNASELVIDEEFHLRQGQNYCQGDFFIWDPKITTFPGLYIISSIFLLPLNLCSTIALRSISLIASIINVCLIYEIRRNFSQKVNSIKIALESFVLSILPPMYLFAHLYYTDILSVTMVLGMFLFNIKQRHNIAAVFALLSVLMRQTNIVWVGMFLGYTCMDKLVSQTLPFIKGMEKRSAYTFHDIFLVLGFYLKRFYLVPKQIRLLFVYLLGYIIVITGFLAFVYWNGSIVVGDKSAHEAAIHLPQIFYFSLFFLTFSPSVAFTHIFSAFHTIRKRWYFIVPMGFLFAAIIYKNTIVHPYLLADNRHYVFYVWNKFYGKYWWAKYSMIPMYLISLIILYYSISVRSAGFKLLFTLCTIVVIGLQQLIEIRYFIMPYLIVRLSMTSVKFRLLLLELIMHCLLNAIVFYLFTTKEIYWNDYKSVQRIIW